MNIEDFTIKSPQYTPFSFEDENGKVLLQVKDSQLIFSNAAKVDVIKTNVKDLEGNKIGYHLTFKVSLLNKESK